MRIQITNISGSTQSHQLSNKKYYKEDFYLKKISFNDSSFEVQQKDKLFFDSRWNRVHDICKSYLGDLKNKLYMTLALNAQALIFFKERGLICSGIERRGVNMLEKRG